jgi:flagellar hook assembly protein FlgD
MIDGTDSVNCWNTLTVPDGYYWVKVTASDEFGNSRTDSMRVRVKNLVGVAENENLTGNNILRIAPNPVRTTARISKGQSAKGIALHIYDISGSLIRSFTLGPMPSALNWDLTDQNGRPVPCGAYFLESGDVRIKFTVAK